MLSFAVVAGGDAFQLGWHMDSQKGSFSLNEHFVFCHSVSIGSFRYVCNLHLNHT